MRLCLRQPETAMSNPYSAPDNQETPHISAGLQQRVRGLQVVVSALAAGATFFAGIVLVAKSGAIGWEPNPVSWIAVGFASFALVLSIVVPGTVSRAALSRISPESLRSANEATELELLFPVYQQRCIMACGLLEGAAFFNLVAYQLNAFVGSLAMAAMLIVLILVRFPSVAGMQLWLRDRIQEIKMMP